MKITVLLENTSCRDDLIHNHGLSLFIETPAHNILFDMGQDGAFAKNAEKLGIDLTSVDTAFLSHGHYDHSGGMADFLTINSRSPVYLHAASFGEYYAKRVGGFDYIGLDTNLHVFDGRFILTDGNAVIDSELQLFSVLDSADLLSGSNGVLLKKDEGGLVPDDFLHEQYLIISTESKNVLIAGCCHRGIVNVMRSATLIIGKAPDYVFSGFHLGNPDTGAAEPAELTRAIAEELKKYPSRYFTGHCTGFKSFDVLKETLGEQIQYMSGGSVFNI